MHGLRVARRRERAGASTLRLFASLVAVVAMSAFAVDARADDSSDYCHKVTAEAQSQAALLMAPSVSAQLIRYPSSTIADTTGLQIGSGVQPRAALSYGVIDLVRGLRVMDAAQADCKRQASAMDLRELVVARADIGRLPALESELTFLTAKKADVDVVLRDAEDRYAAHTTTFIELHAIRKSATSIEQKLHEVAREVAVLRKRGVKMPPRPIDELLNGYDERALSYEDAVSRVRTIQAWKLDLSGGVATSPSVDYFAVASLSYNIGGLFQRGAEKREMDARKGELTNARYELRSQVSGILAELRADYVETEKELRSVEAELVRVDKERAALDTLDAPNKASLVSELTLESVSLGADRAYLSAYLGALASIGGRP